MKNIKLLLLLAAFTMFESISAVSAVPSKDGTVIVHNKSNMPINIGCNYQGHTGEWSKVIAAGKTGTIPYFKGAPVSFVTIYYAVTPAILPDFNKGAMTTTLLNAMTLDVDGRVAFSPEKVEDCTLYVYGNSAVKVGQEDTTAGANNPAFARYAAWWSGNIPDAKNMTVDVAKNNQQVNGLVKVHVANIKGAVDTTQNDPAVIPAF